MPFRAKYKRLPSDRQPSCPHGPTVLFETVTDHKKFFACSAFRDRKGCSFYELKEDFDKNPRKSRIANKRIKVSNNRRLKRILELKPKNRRYCKDCSLLLPADEQPSHQKHQLLQQVADKSILFPISNLLSSKSVDKHEAQYSFAGESKAFILNQLEQRGLKRVICMGTPAIHEAIQSRDNSTGTDTLLMDIDHRIAQFYPRSKFVWFNMFNHFFLEGESGEKRLDRFIGSSRGKEIALVVDPPFGGFIELLSQTVNFLFDKIRSLHNVQQIPVILCLPFFLSSFVSKTLPSLKMSEYRVQYTNHSKYKKTSSPVRIFTNIPLKDFVLPAEAGYKFCSHCQKSVPDFANHCGQCKSCTAFGNNPAFHCPDCKRCVKSSLKHCKKCNKCLPLQHEHGVGRDKQSGAAARKKAPQGASRKQGPDQRQKQK